MPLFFFSVAFIAGMSSSDESEENAKEESAVHKINSKITSAERERAEAAARVSAYSILTACGQKLTAEQKKMLLNEHRNDVAMHRRECTTALQEIYDFDSSRKSINMSSIIY